MLAYLLIPLFGLGIAAVFSAVEDELESLEETSGETTNATGASGEDLLDDQGTQDIINFLRGQSTVEEGERGEEDDDVETIETIERLQAAGMTEEIGVDAAEETAHDCAVSETTATTDSAETVQAEAKKGFDGKRVDKFAKSGDAPASMPEEAAEPPAEMVDMQTGDEDIADSGDIIAAPDPDEMTDVADMGETPDMAEAPDMAEEMPEEVIDVAEGDALTAGSEGLLGSAGDDILESNPGEDTVSGGPGDDEITGFDATDPGDLAEADTGADVLVGGTGNDTLTGNDGDEITSGEGEDVVRVLGLDRIGEEAVVVTDFDPEEDVLVLVDSANEDVDFGDTSASVVGGLNPASIVEIRSTEDGESTEVIYDSQVVALLRGTEIAELNRQTAWLANRDALVLVQFAQQAA